MNRTLALLRFLWLGLVRGLQSLLIVPARAIASIDRVVVDRTVGAARGSYWFAAALLAYLVERYPTLLSALAILIAVVLLVALP